MAVTKRSLSGAPGIMPGESGGMPVPPDGGTGGGEGIDLAQLLLRGGMGGLQGGMGGALGAVLQQLLTQKLGPGAKMQKRGPAAGPAPAMMGDATGGMPHA